MWFKATFFIQNDIYKGYKLQSNKIVSFFDLNMKVIFSPKLPRTPRDAAKPTRLPLSTLQKAKKTSSRSCTTLVAVKVTMKFLSSHNNLSLSFKLLMGLNNLKFSVLNINKRNICLCTGLSNRIKAQIR
jgi:hypothetical protein